MELSLLRHGEQRNLDNFAVVRRGILQTGPWNFEKFSAENCESYRSQNTQSHLLSRKASAIAKNINDLPMLIKVVIWRIYIGYNHSIQSVIVKASIMATRCCPGWGISGYMLYNQTIPWAKLVDSQISLGGMSSTDAVHDSKCLKQLQATFNLCFVYTVQNQTTSMILYFLVFLTNNQHSLWVHDQSLSII